MQKGKPQKGTTLLNKEQTVDRYFDLVSRKDVDGLLDLFAADAVVNEPFSNLEGGLRGKSAIENFLKVVVMANEGLRRTIEFVDRSGNSITAVITFQRGGTIKGKFTFNFVVEEIGRKIKTLTIAFNGF